MSYPSRTEEHQVLGILWNLASDQFLSDISDITQLAPDLSTTKRNLVSLIGKIYDPLGFLSPVIVRYKILFQKLCQCTCKPDWGEVIPEKLNGEWKLLVSDLKMAMRLSLPKSYFYELTDPAISVTLCGFHDTSTKAYAAVVYLILKTKN